jgi:hypothetical protein
MKLERIGAALLIALALAQIIGDLTGVQAIEGVAAATGASPAPKVFSSAQGLETFSTRFFLEWPDQRIEVTPEIYSRVRGPYNRRNVYGAALAYAPVLPGAMRSPVMRYALCGNAPLLRELTGDQTLSPSWVEVSLEPLVEPRNLPLRFRILCE